MIVDADAEGFRDRVRRDVVMRRPDAAGGEDIGVARTQRVQGGYDLVFDVAHDARFLEIDAERAKLPGDVVGVGVLRAARENLVADDEHGCGGIFAHAAF